jgi:hypothetical protein
MNILDAVRDNKVFGPHFRRTDTWALWMVFLAALFALPMTSEQLALYQRHTGRSTPPTNPHHEAWLCIGRRGGKSFMLALIAVFLACFRDWRPFLGPGEIGTIAVIAADRRQARTIMRYCLGLIEATPMLKRQIVGQTQDSVTLKNNIVIEVHTASFRTTRGYTIIAALLDEIAFWPTDDNAAEQDLEVINAVKPGMATVPDAMLLCASSPHARKGALWEAYRKHFAQDNDPVLVWQATTRDMNPSVPQSYIDQHMADDEARASAEYLAMFRTDLEAFVLREVVDANVSKGVYERPFDPNISYAGDVDPSGGSSDSMTLCIGHQDYGRSAVVIDCLREAKPPFSPEQVVEEFAAVLKSYHITAIRGDRYAGMWPVELFGRHGILYEQNARPKSELYRDLLPLLNSCRIDLLDNQKMLAQLLGLERRVARGGKDSIDHSPGSHDDLINAVALVASSLTELGAYPPGGLGPWLDGPETTNQQTLDSRAWRAQQLAGALEGMVNLANTPSWNNRRLF